MRLTMLLDMVADTAGDRIVVGSRAGGITAAGLRDRARAGAAVLRASGADALVYLGVNGPAFPVALFAAALADVPLVPLNYRLGEEQLTALLARHPGAYGVGDEGGGAALRAAGIAAVDAATWLATTAERPVDEPVDEPGDEPWDPERTAVVIYTSGTTSAPKGVLLRHGNLASYVLGTVEFLAAAEDDAALVSVPPYHIAAVANVISNLYAGRRTLVLEQFSPDEWLTTVREERITNALVVPTMLSRIIETGSDLAVPSLRGLAYGGAPMPGALIEKALRTWPEVGFVNAYGLTETSSTVAVLGPEQHRASLASDDPDVRARLSSVGQVVPGVELAVLDDDGVPLPAGEVGRICVRGDQVSGEYDGQGRAVDDDGWFDTRDRGHLDASGYLFLGGRVDDTIIRGAENIAPAEIEEVILHHPDVVDVAVIGVPDEEWGQRIEAVVVLRDGRALEAGELRVFVLQRLRSSKTPERFLFWPELPRTETGKLVRRDVLRQATLS
ncbi:long-chain fatty acid--CoA ligase [Nocardioides marmoriginsengisoli]|uniref:Long-chain fatty acid--CoA ligase n=1 Tax=Nocardioides marmoriginsengisoli TaxID=661483 RepID=A0A3N0CCA5_9ACTN|nr:AMP-binding protein [Nocardioides marmoriginsengisoli]RNL61087.1 long-chain fatty acid--CoA ligase [Nocardioides marmoriginsengisoli]